MRLGALSLSPGGLWLPSAHASAPSLFAQLGLPATDCKLLLVGGMWTPSSGAVATWLDQSGNGNDVPGTGSLRPLVSTMGSIPAALFDGIDDRLVRAAGTFTVPSPFTIVLAGYLSGNNQAFCDTADPAVRAVVYQANSDVIGAGGAGGSAIMVGDITTAKVLVAVGDGGSSQVWLSGTQLVLVGTVSGEGFDGITIGAAYSGSFLSGPIGIFAVYTRALTPTEIAAATSGIRSYAGI